MRNQKRRVNLLLILVVLFVNARVQAQLELPEDKVSWKFSVEQNGCEAYVVADVSMVEHWHIYAAKLPEGTFLLPTELNLEKSANYRTIGGVIEPTPIFEHDEMADEDLYYHSGKVKIKRKIEVISKEDFTVKGTFTFQTCDDSHCLPPHSVDFEVKVKGCVSESDESEVAEVEFVEVNNDEAIDKKGNTYVKFNDEWVLVPEGNSIAFFKKYLELGGSYEK